jgi:hypothetical protein
MQGLTMVEPAMTGTDHLAYEASTGVLVLMIVAAVAVILCLVLSGTRNAQRTKDQIASYTPAKPSKLKGQRILVLVTLTLTLTLSLNLSLTLTLTLSLPTPLPLLLPIPIPLSLLISLPLPIPLPFILPGQPARGQSDRTNHLEGNSRAHV